MNENELRRGLEALVKEWGDKRDTYVSLMDRRSHLAGMASFFQGCEATYDIVIMRLSKLLADTSAPPTEL